MKMLQINEIFYSLQGEGLWMGIPNIFIRTTGCNLRCTYCDTVQAYDQGNECSLEQILDNCSQFPCKNICITGGEPLIQKNIESLCEILLENGYKICVETNGSQTVEPLLHYPNLFFSLDIKCPSSGMQKYNDINNYSLIRSFDQIKCIMGNRSDYEYAKNICLDYSFPCPVFFQPVWGFSLETLSKWILEDALPVRLGIQLHKYIWGNNTGR